MQIDFIQDFFKVLKNEIQGVNFAEHVLILSIETLVILILGRVFQKKKWITLKKAFYIFLVLAYTDMLLTLTIFRREPGSRAGIMHLDITIGLGLMTGEPSAKIFSYALLNILLFVPLGMLVYQIFRNLRSKVVIFATVLMGLLTSLIIEDTQLLAGRGMFEITDLVTNTFGSFVGAIIADIIYRIIIKSRKQP